MEIAKQESPLQESTLQELPGQLEKMRIAFAGFTTGIKTCFISADASQLEDFKNLRHIILDDTLIYFKVVAPTTKLVFESVFSTFKICSFISNQEKFLMAIPLLIQNADKLATQLRFCKELHEETLQTAAGRSILAEKLDMKLQLSETQQKEVHQFHIKNINESKANILKKQIVLPKWFNDIPFASIIVGMLSDVLTKSEREKIEQEHIKAILSLEKSQCASIAARLVKNTIVPALQDYIDSMAASISIITAFLMNLRSIEDLSKNIEGKQSAVAIFYESIMKELYAVMKGSTMMVAYYDISNCYFKAFEGFTDSKSYIEEWMSEFIPKEKQKSFWQRIKELFLKEKAVVKEMKIEEAIEFDKCDVMFEVKRAVKFT